MFQAVLKIFKFAVTSAFVFGPIYFFGAKAVPMIRESLAQTQAIQAKNDAIRQQRLDSLAELANENGDLGAGRERVQLELESKRESEPQPKKTVVIEHAYDPSPEAQIEAMSIPETTKQEILRNYRRTGFMPQIESAQKTRLPTSAE